jgi:hypothetical protein
MTQAGSAPMRLKQVRRDLGARCIRRCEEKEVHNRVLIISHRKRFWHVPETGHIFQPLPKRSNDRIHFGPPFQGPEQVVYCFIRYVAPRMVSPKPIHPIDITRVNSRMIVPEDVPLHIDGWKIQKDFDTPGCPRRANDLPIKV